MIRRALALLLLALSGFSAPALAHAPATSSRPAVAGIVSGTVWEIRGFYIYRSVGATVTLRNTATSKSYGGWVTDFNGNFTAIVPDGTYQVSARRATYRGTCPWLVVAGPVNRPTAVVNMH